MNTNNQIEYFTLLLKSEDLLGILDENLPTPNKIKLFEGLVPKFAIMYQIAGFTGTKKSRQFFNDIIARFFLTLPVQERLLYELDTEYQHEKIYQLKAFSNLKSLKTHFGEVNYTPKNNDLIFWSLKVFIEQKIIENKENGGIVVYCIVEDWAFTMFEHKAKDRSTLKAKCRNVWHWYEKRDWKLHLFNKQKKSKEEVMATRTIQAEKARKKLMVDTQNKVQNAINLLRLENEKVNANTISQKAGVTYRTAKKYLDKLLGK